MNLTFIIFYSTLARFLRGAFCTTYWCSESSFSGSLIFFVWIDITIMDKHLKHLLLCNLGTKFIMLDAEVSLNHYNISLFIFVSKINLVIIIWFLCRLNPSLSCSWLLKCYLPNYYLAIQVVWRDSLKNRLLLLFGQPTKSQIVVDVFEHVVCFRLKF